MQREIKCVLKDNVKGYRFDLEIIDENFKVFSTKDDDGIWGTPFENIEDKPPFVTLEHIDKCMAGEDVIINSPEAYWHTKGYIIQQVKKFDGKIKTVWIQLDESLLDGVTSVFCPYAGCGHSHRVEPDANYTIICEGCGNPYNVRSPI